MFTSHPSSRCQKSLSLTWSFLSTWQLPAAPSTAPCTDCAPSRHGPSPPGWSAAAGRWECCPAGGRRTASTNGKWKGTQVSKAQARQLKSQSFFLAFFTAPPPPPLRPSMHFNVSQDNQAASLQKESVASGAGFVNKVLIKSTSL